MIYRLEFSDAAKKDLKKLDKNDALLLLGWMRKNLDGMENPRIRGKQLVGNLAGVWRYRVGDYRILACIEDDKLVILVVSVGHRREIYMK